MDGNDYVGEVKDFTRIVSKAFLEFLKAHAWKTSLGGAMDPMGGMGMDMGGGMPPMGGMM